MSEEVKKAIERAKFLVSIPTYLEKEMCKNLLNYIDKQQKVIDLMAELLCGIDVMNELGRESWNWNKEQMKEYFYKKAEE